MSKDERVKMEGLVSAELEAVEYVCEAQSAWRGDRVNEAPELLGVYSTALADCGRSGRQVWGY